MDEVIKLLDKDLIGLLINQKNKHLDDEIMHMALNCSSIAAANFLSIG